MAISAKEATNSRRSASEAERPVVHYGIKIAPIAGKRSPTAQTIRDVLRTKSKPGRGKPAHA